MKQIDGASAIVAFTNPFRLVLRDQKDCWTATLDQINDCTYDYIKLHRLSVSLDIGLPDPLCLHIAYDGSLLLPKIPNFWPIEKAVAAFNQALGEILLGGIYFDAIQPTDIDQATLFRTGYFRPRGLVTSLTAQLHFQLHSMVAGPLQSILLHEPQHILARDLFVAHKKGVEVVAKINTLASSFYFTASRRLSPTTGLQLFRTSGFQSSNSSVSCGKNTSSSRADNQRPKSKVVQSFSMTIALG